MKGFEIWKERNCLAVSNLSGKLKNSGIEQLIPALYKTEGPHIYCGFLAMCIM